MGKIKDFTKKLKGVTVEEQEAELVRIIQRYEKVVLDLNRSQLMAGIDAEGKSLGTYKSESYARMKRTLNPRGVVDLKLQGSFHGNFFLVSELPLIIWSYDEKTEELVKKYGKNIFGLTDQNTQVLIVGYIKKEFEEWYKRRLL